MNVRLIKLTKKYYFQLAEMIDEWKLCLKHRFY
jgi:hypothetical protein